MIDQILAELPKHGYTVFGNGPDDVKEGGMAWVVRAGRDGMEVALKISKDAVTNPNAEKELKWLQVNNRLLLYNGLAPFLGLKIEFLGGADRLVSIWGWADGTLAELQSQHRANGASGIPVGELLAYMHHVGVGLDFLHNLEPGIFHGDIKPSNLLWYNFQGVKFACLGDVGLLVCYGVTTPSPASARTPYTPQYAPPEVRNGGLWSDVGDLFSLAVSYVELRIGDRPDVNHVHNGHVKFNGTGMVPQEAELVAQALATDPAQRFNRGVLSWVRALRQAVGQATTVSVPPAVPLGAILETFLLRVIAHAEQLPVYFPYGARLDNIRVQVRVRTEVQQPDRLRDLQTETERRATGYESGNAYQHRHHQEQDGDQSAKEELLDWDTQLRDKLLRGVILADPGLGKSWLLKWEARRLALAALEGLRKQVKLEDLTLPLFVRCEDLGSALKAESQSPAANRLPGALLRAMAAPEELHAVFLQAIQENRARLLLDAWDEAAAEHHTLLRSALRGWVESDPKSSVLVTSRIVGQPGTIWPRPMNAENDREWELQPFGAAQQQAFVDNFFAGNAAVAAAVKHQLGTAPQLNGLAQIPLLLGYLCAYVQVNFVDKEAEPILASLRRGDLYEFVVTNLLRGTWHEGERQAAELTEQKLLDEQGLLSHVAYLLLEDGRQQFTFDEFRDALRKAYQHRYESPLAEKKEKKLLARFIEKSGLLLRVGASLDARHLFLHLTVQEYLAARHEIQLTSEKRGRIVGRLWDHPAWREVWDLVAQGLGKAGNAAALEAMVAAAFQNIHRLDARLHRHRLQALRWIILAAIEPTAATPQIKEVVAWAVNELRGAPHAAEYLLSSLGAVTGRLPQSFQAALLDCLTNVDSSVKVMAVDALAACAGSDPVQSRLLEMLGDRNENVRYAVVRSLAAYASSSPVQAQLKGMLGDEQDGDVHRVIVDALAPYAWADKTI